MVDASQRSKAERIIHQLHPTLDITELDNDSINLGLSTASLNEARDLAIEQNLTILRKRVAELGVSEAVIQRQGAERIVIELPGVQDTARAKEILGATATLEFRIVNQNCYSRCNFSLICYQPIRKLNSDRQGHPVALFKRAVLGGEHIINSSSGLDPHSSTLQVSVTLDGEGGEIMSQTTKKYYKKPMATLYVEYKITVKR